MTFSCRHETIDVKTAHEYLSRSAGNRHLNADHVLSLAVAMESGKWDENASEIVFDDNDQLIDGHHRLNAIISYGGEVRMLVKRGVSAAARAVIDTGVTRRVSDLFTMFRPGVTYTNQRKAALTTCISLVVPGRAPVIRTLDAFDSWMRHFKDGMDELIPLACAANGPLKTGPVLGAFVFAHKTHPEEVKTFMLHVRDGLGLRANEPATTLRGLLFSGSLSRGRGVDRNALSRKVLQAIFAEIKGKSYAKAQAGNEGLLYFRKAYDSRSIEKLISLWTAPESVPATEVES